MKKPVLFAFLFCTLSFTAALTAQAAPEDDIRAASKLWIEGISKGDPDYMLSLYDENAILHGTVSPVLRKGHALIREYFEGIVASPPTMFFVEPQNIRIFGDTAVNTGNYASQFGDAEPVILRYSFVYHKSGDKWLIVDHHSSRLPE